MFLLYVAVFTWIVSEVRCQDCREDSIRLVGGRSEFEGRVEIFRDGCWGTVCDDEWGEEDASVVCRQLGLSQEGSVALREAFFGQGSGPIFLDNVRCQEADERLADCPVRQQRGHDCNHREDAGVRCREGTLPAITVQTNHTDATSIAMSWRATPAADAYNVTVTTTLNTSGVRQTYFINTEIPINQTEIEYRDLLPEQTYRVCVTGFFCHRQVISSCTSIQTLPILIPQCQPSPTPQFSPTSESTSANSTLLGGVLGFIIALLVLLLIVAGVGLAYPRCIRSRVKDKKYLSNISQFLDKNMYLTSNAAYIDRNQGDSGAEIYVPPTYEAVPDPPSGPRTGNTANRPYEVLEPTPGEPGHGLAISQVTADIVAQHYEMHEATDPEHSAEPAVYEVPVNEGGDSKEPARDYSRLQYQ